MYAIVKRMREPGGEIATVDAPKVGGDEVLVKLKAVSICGTDVHVWNWNEWAQRRVKKVPIIFGHECAGEVVELGSDVTSLREGDKVSAEGHIVDGSCYQCRMGRMHICQNVEILGVDRNGVFAEYVTLPERNAWRNDPNLDPLIASLQDPLGNAVHAILPKDNLEDVAGSYVAVLGCGPIGLMAIAVAKELGASRVFATAGGHNVVRMGLAKKMGADMVLSASEVEEEIVRTILNATDGRGVDVALEMSGAPSAVRQAFKILTPGGRVSLLGLQNEPMELDLSNDVIFKGAKVYGITGRRMFQTWYQMKEFQDLVNKGLNWKLRILQGPSTPRCLVDGKEVLMLSSNNYLGLSTHPHLIEAATKAIKGYGVGAGAVRAISGNMDLHVELEKRLASFKHAEASLTYPTGFAVNAGLIPQLADREDLIISDQLNHGSIIDGVRLSRAERAIYNHCDMGDLERVLNEAEKRAPSYRRILIIIDGVFSMDGDVAPLDQIAKLGEEHGAMVYVDDAHGEGVLGEGGRGIVSHFKLDRERVHVEMGTFSKAFGVMGGHLSGSQDLVNFAYNRSRTWLLSTCQTPADVAACIAAIDVLEREPQHVKRLWDNTRYFKKAVEDLGFNAGLSQTPIIPIIVGESSIARKLSTRLYEEGILALPIVYPMVARDQARIRTQMNAQLTKEDLNFAIENLEKIGKELAII